MEEEEQQQQQEQEQEQEQEEGRFPPRGSRCELSSDLAYIYCILGTR